MSQCRAHGYGGNCLNSTSEIMLDHMYCVGRMKYHQDVTAEQLVDDESVTDRCAKPQCENEKSGQKNHCTARMIVPILLHIFDITDSEGNFSDACTQGACNNMIVDV